MFAVRSRSIDNKVTMDHPTPGKWATIEGQPGAYVVLRVNDCRASADLLLIGDECKFEFDVPFFALESIGTHRES